MRKTKRPHGTMSNERTTQGLGNEYRGAEYGERWERVKGSWGVGIHGATRKGKRRKMWQEERNKYRKRGGKET